MFTFRHHLHEHMQLCIRYQRARVRHSGPEITTTDEEGKGKEQLRRYQIKYKIHQNIVSQKKVFAPPRPIRRVLRGAVISTTFCLTSDGIISAAAVVVLFFVATMRFGWCQPPSPPKTNRFWRTRVGI